MSGMEKLTRAVLEWGSPVYLKKEPAAVHELKGFMALEGLPVADEDVEKFLNGLAKKYQKHIDHYWLLTDLMLDFKTTSQLYFLNAERTKGYGADGVRLDKTSHLRVHIILAIISYSKLKEIIASYGKEKRNFNDHKLDKRLNVLMSLIDSSGIVSYRNSYIAHAFVKEKERASFALHYREGAELIKNILAVFNKKEIRQVNLDEDFDGFFLRIYNGSDNSSVVYLIDEFKEKIRSVYLHGYKINR